MSATQTRHNELFTWSHGRVVLFVDRSDDAWTVARAWRLGDRLIDVRRWRFDCERRLIGQMRRLVREATQEYPTGDVVAARVADWITGSPGSA
jgi:hypothetical protein